MPGPPRRAHGLALAALAGAVHLACDAAAAQVHAIAPPYLLLDHAAELFRDLLALDRTAILVTVSVAASAVNGAIAALMAVALEDAPRRRRALAWVLTAFWVLSGGLLILVYLSPPWGVALGSLAAGVPRAWAVAWVLDRALGRPEPATPEDGARRPDGLPPA
ncbi:conserved hypothetical protein [Anaeromyxobacter sp. K]|uniref:hypothetical protein n=1 Tax=Anaeromyxobacter sp. (strain K) TaxID=447217 RepID=UPI00015F852C|nr:hypothetical protein [Anaeromyxobacter sp. K]ACG72674.1 conserved hypothetical protein [Anaeromyxobacter sp. K]